MFRKKYLKTKLQQFSVITYNAIPRNGRDTPDAYFGLNKVPVPVTDVPYTGTACKSNSGKNVRTLNIIMLTSSAAEPYPFYSNS